MKYRHFDSSESWFFPSQPLPSFFKIQVALPCLVYTDNLILPKKEAQANSSRRAFVTELSSVERRQVTRSLYIIVKFSKQFFNLWLFQKPNYSASTDWYLYFYGEKAKNTEIGTIQ